MPLRPINPVVMNMNSSLSNAAVLHGYEPLSPAVEDFVSGRAAPGVLTEIATKRILLADDDPGVREMLGRVLESEQYAVSFARTGREAAARFEAEPPDLVLLDLNMPDKDGWEAFGLMCNKHPMIPVIVITARPQQYQTAVDLGVDALMEKPLNLPLLLETIQHLAGETEAERTRRLTDPEFRTAYLKSSIRKLQPEAGA